MGAHAGGSRQAAQEPPLDSRGSDADEDSGEATEEDADRAPPRSRRQLICDIGDDDTNNALPAVEPLRPAGVGVEEGPVVTADESLVAEVAPGQKAAGPSLVENRRRRDFPGPREGRRHGRAHRGLLHGPRRWSQDDA